ncbi:hypothetical protein PISMIDRAFT_182859 [Pisolithus microcarpus 441]|uniref:Uncharacterized protein n=1 Tax=Pisolithus microcarpus 441 TaxID=765257 RepID=A0A0C9ZEZ5_9AGAM|nr:hypothetical protein BKA83DRAFT_182859 [Pisolithus microcarpus]KIK18533.1 hypothetical protein PISMIDRAFT_182859 [Pisolithus microcarpus 441]
MYTAPKSFDRYTDMLLTNAIRHPSQVSGIHAFGSYKLPVESLLEAALFVPASTNPACPVPGPGAPEHRRLVPCAQTCCVQLALYFQPFSAEPSTYRIHQKQNFHYTNRRLGTFIPSLHSLTRRRHAKGTSRAEGLHSYKSICMALSG